MGNIERFPGFPAVELAAAVVFVDFRETFREFDPPAARTASVLFPDHRAVFRVSEPLLRITHILQDFAKELRLAVGRGTVQDPDVDLFVLQLLPFFAYLREVVAQICQGWDVKTVIRLDHGQKTVEFREIRVSTGVGKD